MMNWYSSIEGYKDKFESVKIAEPLLVKLEVMQL